MIATRLMAAGGLRPRAIIGFSIGGFLGWLLDRFLVAVKVGSDAGDQRSTAAR